jgi:uncharacterized membrane protein required for colicin V production
VTVVDLVVLAVVLVAALRGWRRGGTGLVLRAAGAVAGVLIAGALARWLVPLLVAPDATVSRGAIIIGAALVGALVGWSVGRRLGETLAARRGGGFRRPGLPDRALGVVAHGALALMLLVLAVGVVSAFGPTGLGDAARDSSVLGAAAQHLPNPLTLLPSGGATLADGGAR